jgi:glycosyltransferase involved in cell wall biosynthesis
MFHNKEETTLKLLSIAIPCYNSENYMRKCIDSLLIGGEDVEIIIVNDGSSDSTAQIADEYASNYPLIVKVIHQENGGHGEAVNTGLKNATGLYFKVVDSDDWVNDVAYSQILDTLRNIIGGNKALDMLISNFVYEKQGATHKKVMSYRMAFPQNTIFTWNQVRHFHKGQYILMHSVIYRTQLLIDCGLVLPKHTFYVDNIFVYQPLPFVKTMYYLNVNFYRYFIGRDDQSVHESVMINRIDQQILVNKLMIDSYDIYKLNNRKLRNYMISYIEIITTVSSILLIRSGSDENFDKKQALWKYLKQKNPRLYFRLRFGLLGRYVNLPGKGGRTVSVAGYKLIQKFFGFN